MAEIGIRKTHDNLRKKLSDYIKAQYFAENDLLMDVADTMLDKEGVTYREPYIEVAKSYKQTMDGFESASIDINYKIILNQLVEQNLGVFNTPFVHQVKALENFYSGKNIVVTTGTGSGKTECFLWPILTNLIYEARFNPETWQQEGIRALVLYPMNALVSDQLGRMRRIVGRKDDKYNELLQSNGKRRRARFGMYTGRTAYAGPDNAEKNRKLAKILQKNFFENESREALDKIGRIPAKNMKAFINSLQNGTQQTSESDAELYTRYEMQKICPDILITNYSMLEYMLMRPIEDSLWNKTLEWLHKSEDNKLLLVIDEAHMYRGASGGEVSLLIRRLMDRLQIDKGKLHCILTSASVPKNGNKSLQEFAQDLTGTDNEFAVVREEVNKIDGFRCGTYSEAEFYRSLSLNNLRGTCDEQIKEIKKIADKMGVSCPSCNTKSIEEWLYNIFYKDPLMKNILHICAQNAEPLKEIATKCFEKSVDQSLAEAALERLLQLGVMAKSNVGRVLIQSKVHMMFRGIQGLYACTNSLCSEHHAGMGIKLGYITNQRMDTCPYCNSRMFEVMMDRRCGTLYLRAYVSENQPYVANFNFLWPKKNEIVKGPHEIHLWIMPPDRKDIFKPNAKRGKARENSSIGYLDSATGFLFHDETHANQDGYLKVLIPETLNESGVYTFNTCPNCGRDHNVISSFVTRGNEPFANIVREQFDSQPEKDTRLKNKGKKVLLFSDSRQRAATLARDLTVESDGDAGRQAIFVAQKLLDKNVEDGLDEDATLNLLYMAFLRVVEKNKLNFFYGKEKDVFEAHLEKFRKLTVGKSKIKYHRLQKKIGNAPQMFYQLLLKNISNSYRSYNNLYLGQIVLAEKGEAGDEIQEELLEKAYIDTGLPVSDIKDIYNTWIQYLVTRSAVFPEIDDGVRNSILSYERGGYGIDEKTQLPSFLDKLVKKHGLSDEQIQMLISHFMIITDMLEVPDKSHNRRYILGSRIELRTAENSDWYKCDRCAGASTYTLWGHCIYCGSNKHIRKIHQGNADRYALWTNPVYEAIKGKPIININTEEHTAQLSYKDNGKDVFGTTEKYELAFRNVISDNQDPIDILSCTTTMEVGIDIGDLISVGLRNVPPMRENYQQRAGRAGRAGAAVSSIVTYTENGPHDAWYFNNPAEIISGEPRVPWIDAKNIKLIRRHINLILIEEYLRQFNKGLDEIYTIDFFNDTNLISYIGFLEWEKSKIPFENKRAGRLIPVNAFDWKEYGKYLKDFLEKIAKKVKESEFIYTPPAIKGDKEDESDTYKLMDVFFAEGFLPNYSFPRNIVHFWIQDERGLIKESPERSMDIALSEYAPGRSLVINKQTYISGGLFDYYTVLHNENRYKAAEPWLKLNEYRHLVKYCPSQNCGWFGVDSNLEICPLCGTVLEEREMIKPWGFSPREAKSVPETLDRQEMSYASTPSYSSMPSGTKMESVGLAGLIHIENRNDQKLVILNSGPEGQGFRLCHICGAIEPATISSGEVMKRKRPYRVPHFRDDLGKCNHDYIDVFLGYEFNTDLMVLEIELDPQRLDLQPSYALWIIPALTTFAEALSQAASLQLDVEYSDIKSGYRLRNSGERLYADIYLYDSLSSGAGYAARASKFIESILDKMEIILSECDCDGSCPNCLENFYNQREKHKLDRFIGLAFLKFIRNGEIDMYVSETRKDSFVKELNKIAMLQGRGTIIEKKNGVYILHTSSGDKKLVIYPALFNPRLLNDCLAISDRRCKYDMESVWEELVVKL